ncbi:MAG TPA: hypothetical protein DIW24_09500 [Bacteroidetes bacterium]|nr:hypothetical protein [Bacteroidota bacterium]HRR10064.1 hypothetical protein [Rhodothermales bacterium]
MESRNIIGIELSGDTLRYAEVQRQAQSWQLVRLGSCGFDFNVAEALLGHESHPEALETLRLALNNVFGEGYSAEVRLALHPNQGYSFYVPVSSGLDEAARARVFLQEARTIVGTETPKLHFWPQPLYVEEFENGETVTWYHISVVFKDVYNRFAACLQDFNRVRYQFVSLETSVAKVISERMANETEQGRQRLPFILALGCYESHTEFLLCRLSNLHFSTFAEGIKPEESTRHSLQMMERLHFLPTMVGSIFIYGNPVDITAFASLTYAFGVTPKLLNPMTLMGDLSDRLLDTNTSLSPFVPCLGAALLS